VIVSVDVSASVNATMIVSVDVKVKKSVIATKNAMIVARTKNNL
jgi:hypothetical protein